MTKTSIRKSPSDKPGAIRGEATQKSRKEAASLALSPSMPEDGVMREMTMAADQQSFQDLGGGIYTRLT